MWNPHETGEAASVSKLSSGLAMSSLNPWTVFGVFSGEPLTRTNQCLDPMLQQNRNHVDAKFPRAVK